MTYYRATAHAGNHGRLLAAVVQAPDAETARRQGTIVLEQLHGRLLDAPAVREMSTAEVDHVFGFSRSAR